MLNTRWICDDGPLKGTENQTKTIVVEQVVKSIIMCASSVHSMCNHIRQNGPYRNKQSHATNRFDVKIYKKKTASYSNAITTDHRKKIEVFSLRRHYNL